MKILLRIFMLFTALTTATPSVYASLIALGQSLVTNRFEIISLDPGTGNIISLSPVAPDSDSFFGSPIEGRNGNFYLYSGSLTAGGLTTLYDHDAHTGNLRSAVKLTLPVGFANRTEFRLTSAGLISIGQNLSTNEFAIFSLDLDTGKIVAINTVDFGGSVGNIISGSNDNFYVIAAGNTALYEIDALTGRVRSVVPLSPPSGIVNRSEFRATTDGLISIGQRILTNEFETLRLNPTTGGITVLSKLELGGAGFYGNPIRGEPGKIYLISGFQSLINEIDTATGEITKTTSLNFPSGLVSRTEFVAWEPTRDYTPNSISSTLTLIFLGLLFGGLQKTIYGTMKSMGLSTGTLAE